MGRQFSRKDAIRISFAPTPRKPGGLISAPHPNILTANVKPGNETDSLGFRHHGERGRRVKAYLFYGNRHAVNCYDSRPAAGQPAGDRDDYRLY